MISVVMNKVLILKTLKTDSVKTESFHCTLYSVHSIVFYNMLSVVNSNRTHIKYVLPYATAVTVLFKPNIFCCNRFLIPNYWNMPFCRTFSMQDPL